MEKLKKEKPKEYKELETVYVFMAQTLFAKMGCWAGSFDGILDDKTKRALRAYEKKRKIPETGNPLSFETMQQLEADTELLESEPMSLPSLSVFTDYWDRGYVEASGTWVIIGDKIAFPEQTSKISCDRASNTCTVATAYIHRYDASGSLSLFVEEHEIERWDEHEIVTKPLESAVGCVRYTMRINRLQKSVTSIRSTISNGEMCKDVTVGELYMVLTDGSKVSQELAQEYVKKMRELVDFSPTLEKLLWEEEKSK